MTLRKKKTLLVLNIGSSGIKFALFSLSASAPASQTGLIGRGHLRQSEGALSISYAHKSEDPSEEVVRENQSSVFELMEVLPILFAWLSKNQSDLNMTAIGHRVVHGGTRYLHPTLITKTSLLDLEALIPLAPLHQPACLEAIRSAQAHWPGAQQIACFDTTFHCEQAWVARAFALPREMTDLGIQRFGFHGLSFEYVTSQLPRVLGDKALGRIIVAHLGNGASLCAIQHGRSVATTMGFSALDGLVMGTRCGTLDPGVVLFLLQQLKMTDQQVSDMLYQRSGLLGVSGISADLRVLLKSEAPEASQAIDLFVFRLLGEIGSLAAAMGGLDALVFTGGIGENAAAIRERVVTGCHWLGAKLDPLANSIDLELLHCDSSGMQIAIIPTDEEQMIAVHCADLLKSQK